MVTGKVVRFDEIRGYGFVAPETGGEDVFVHVNDLEVDKRLIAPGAIVEFTVEDGDRGLKASNVRLIESAAGRSADQIDDEGLGDLLSAKEFIEELTEVLLTAAPTLTAEQILRVRKGVAGLARAHGWIEQ